MLVWQTLVATPTISLLRTQRSRPASVRLSTFGLAAALVADDLRALDADERRGVAEAAQLRGDLVGDELAVGEDLEVAVRMRARGS